MILDSVLIFVLFLPKNSCRSFINPPLGGVVPCFEASLATGLWHQPSLSTWVPGQGVSAAELDSVGEAEQLAAVPSLSLLKESAAGSGPAPSGALEHPLSALVLSTLNCCYGLHYILLSMSCDLNP